MDRDQIIIRTSVLGILANLVLAAFKAAVGLASHSIAIVLDAVNNLSDALSSVITIVGTKLAGRKADRKHPYGYGRIEYITSVIIAVLVLMAGFASAKESVVKLIHPVEAEYSLPTLIIVAAAVVVKFTMGRYVKSVGEKLNSGALIASGSDAFFDGILSMATLGAALVSLLFHLQVESLVALAISVMILRAGIGMLKETLSSIIGMRAEPELTNRIKAAVREEPGVLGAFDLTLHNYGPNQIIGSVHVEVPDNTTAREIHAIIRHISSDIFQRFGILLTVGIYASNNTTPETQALRRAITEQMRQHPGLLQMHGLYLDSATGDVSFDFVVDFHCDGPALRDEAIAALQTQFPAYRFHVSLDTQFSD